VDELFLYRFDEAFERKVLKVLCTKWGDRLVKDIVEDSFERPSTKWVVKAILSIVKDTGKSPRDLGTVYQQLHYYHEHDGALTYQQLLELQSFCAQVQTEEVEDEEQTMLMAAKVVVKIEEARVVDEVEKLHSEGAGLEPVAVKIDRLKDIGRVEMTRVTNSEEHLDEILGELDVEEDRDNILPTGVTEWDTALGGGQMLGDFFCYLGNTGDGKSRAMNGQINVALGMGMDVFWASNEMTRRKQMIQWLAASLVIDTGPLSKSKRLKEIAKTRMRDLIMGERALLPRNERRGTWQYAHFVPDEVPIEEYFDAFKREQDRRKKKIPVFAIDYLKRIKYSDAVDGDYKGIGILAMKCRAFAQEEDLFMIGAHQGKARIKPDHIYGKDDGADSKNLSRELDFLGTLNPVNQGRDGIILNGAKLRDAPPMEPFLIQHALAFGCLHKNQVGWIPPAAQPAYLDRIYHDIDFSHVS
jgi:hypothetical protein